MLGVFALLLVPSHGAPATGDWFNGGYRDCYRSTGQCQSSSCTVFGFKNSARTNCHTSGTNPNCIGSVCSYFTPTCKPSSSLTTKCYGYVTCSDGSTNCEGAGLLCLEDGSSTNFKICGDYYCPSINGTCPPPSACPQGLYYDGTTCRRDNCYGITCGSREHCNSAKGSCDCDDGYERVGSSCVADKCADISCSSAAHEHCNSVTGTCDCDDGWERVNGACVVDQCASVSSCIPTNHEHCNAATGSCDCDDGYERVGRLCLPCCPRGYARADDSTCQLDKCLGVTCSADAHQHCNAVTGACDCDNGWVLDQDGVCRVDKCATVTCSDVAHEHCNAQTGTCDCNDGWERVGSACVVDKCAGVSCAPAGHEHCNAATGTCSCDEGWVRLNGVCAEDLCSPKASICTAATHEHCNAATGACDCDDGYERIGDVCLVLCRPGERRLDDTTCAACRECPPHATWDTTLSKCICVDGYVLDSDNVNCVPIKPTPCIVNGQANIMKRKHGKAEDIVVGVMTMQYVAAKNAFTISYNITASAYADLKFKKVWPRLNSRAPKDHSNPRWDTNWIREYTKDTLPTTFVQFTGIQVPDFLCTKVVDTKSLYLSTQLQFWEPNNGGNYRAANGFVDDGDVRTGRDRRDYRVIVQCIPSGSQCDGCAGQCSAPGQHCVWNADGAVTCQCNDGYVEVAGGSCVPEDACAVNGEVCPENSYCQDLKPFARCKCISRYHERKHPKDGSLECVRKCVMNGATSIKLVGGGFAGKVNIVLNEDSPLDAPQYALTYTMTTGLAKSVYFQTGRDRADKHIPSLFQNSVVLSTATNSLRYPTDSTMWLPLNGTIDCTDGADNVYFISTQVGVIQSGIGVKAWGKGKRNDDANAQDFEFRIKCHASCPAAANCHNCHANADCVWDHNSANANKYTCKCNPGFKGDGASACDDIDECALGVATVCGANAACQNLVGSYQCSCNNKYAYDAVLGCISSSTTLTRRTAVEEDFVSVVPEPISGCSAPFWMWLVLGALITTSTVLLGVSCFQRSMIRRFNDDNVLKPIIKGQGHSTMASTPGSSFVSPANLRRRPDSMTPTSDKFSKSSSAYDPLHHAE